MQRVKNTIGSIALMLACVSPAFASEQPSEFAVVGGCFGIARRQTSREFGCSPTSREFYDLQRQEVAGSILILALDRRASLRLDA